ncbi:uncharacterized protein TNCV_3258921 [Trichonephila clavipes]|nr:uncharacterized protein TNCV_3258921 [Trichonephila clavipes]
MSSAFCGIGSLVVKVSDLGCLLTSSVPVPLKTRRVEALCMFNLSRPQTSSRWCDVVVWRGECQLRCGPRHLTMVQNYEVHHPKFSCIFTHSLILNSCISKRFHMNTKIMTNLGTFLLSASSRDPKTDLAHVLLEESISERRGNGFHRKPFSPSISGRNTIRSLSLTLSTGVGIMFITSFIMI